METYLPKWLDRFLERRPAIMLMIVLALAISAALVVLTSGRAIVAYEGF